MGQLLPKLIGAILLVCAIVMPLPAIADEGSSSTSNSEAMLELNLPREVEIGMLTDFVSGRLGMNILYTDAVGRNKVTIHSPTPIPLSSLEGLYRSILKMSGLVLVEAEQDGWWQIVDNRELLSLTDGVREDQQLLLPDSTAVTTHVFRISNIEAGDAEKSIRPLLSKPGGTTQTPGGGILIVTDYASNVKKIHEMLSLIDTTESLPEIRFIPVTHIAANELADRVNELWRKRLEAAGNTKQRSLQPTIIADTRAKRLILISPPNIEQEVLDLIAQFDTPLELVTKSYAFEHTTADRVERMARELIAPTASEIFKTMTDTQSGNLFVSASPELQQQMQLIVDQLDVPSNMTTKSYRLKFIQPRRIDTLAKGFSSVTSTRRADATYRSICDDESGLLVVTGSPKLHEQIAQLIAELDNPEDVSASPIRFYKLYNTVASEVMDTIRSLTDGEADLAALLGSEAELDTAVADSADNSTASNTAKESPAVKDTSIASDIPLATNSDTKDKKSPASIKTSNATISVDENTNSIIVVAPPATQSVYAQLISMLDKRRPQVMVEVILVTVDTSSGKSLGVEVYYNNEDGDTRYYTFSSFGLATAESILDGGSGFNGAVIDSNTFSAVVRAVANDGDSRVLAAPKILAYDNGTATLSSVVESPYTSVNASDTVATTSFGGYASAGATVTVTPHISEGDYLQLAYTVTLNSFTGEGAGGVPPPRQTNTINSEVMIPDGHAVIVGGLTRKDDSHTAIKVPLLGDIPLLGHLFSSHSTSDSDSTLFVFIRPVILRDDKFADLKRMSASSIRQANLSLPPGFDGSEASDANSIADSVGRVMLME